MTKTISALASGLFAVILSMGAFADDSAYNAAKKQAEADHEMAKAACKDFDGADKKACMKQANADHEATEARLKSAKKQ